MEFSEKCPLTMSVQNNEKGHTVKVRASSSHGNQTMLSQETLTLLRLWSFCPALIGGQNKDNESLTLVFIM